MQLPTAGKPSVVQSDTPDGRYVDVVVPVYAPPRIGGRQGAESREVIGYIRLGMSFDRAWARTAEADEGATTGLEG